MKKRCFVIFILFVLCVSLLTAFDAKVTAVKGKVEVKQAGGAWRPAKQGLAVKKGTVISTGFKSELTLKIDGSVIVVKPLTRLKVEDIAKKGESVNSEVFVNVGSISANVKPKSTKRVKFKVKTPVATASVRGTSGIISADGQLIGLTGTWAYTNNLGQKAAVKPGCVVTIDEKGEIIPPQVNAIRNVAVSYKTTLAEEEKAKITVLPVEDSEEFVVGGFATVVTVVAWAAK